MQIGTAPSCRQTITSIKMMMRHCRCLRRPLARLFLHLATMRRWEAPGFVTAAGRTRCRISAGARASERSVKRRRLCQPRCPQPPVVGVHECRAALLRGRRVTNVQHLGTLSVNDDCCKRGRHGRHRLADGCLTVTGRPGRDKATSVSHPPSILSRPSST